MSICRAHFQRVLAAKQAEAAADAGAEPAAGTLAEQMASRMRMHRAALKNIQSLSKKIEAKRGFLPEYAAYAEGVLAADAGGADEVLARVMLWRLDVADYAGALEIADYAVRHDLAMPAGFSRDLPTTLVEEIADAALKTPAADLAEPLSEALALTVASDMPDEVRAKAHKALGKILSETDTAAAIAHYEAAVKLHPGCGVKTELEKLRKRVAAG